MSCKHYQDALTEASARAAEPQGELRAHLETCAACHTAFAAEQALFSSIDLGLHTNANAEVPATLLPRVRARLNEENLRARSWASPRFALAAAATLAVAFLTAQSVWRHRAVQQPARTAANTERSPSAISPLQNPNSIPALPTKEHSIPRPQVATVQHLVPHDSLTSGHLEPEVLVPRDQEILLAGYQQDWQSRKRAPLVTENSVVASLTPLDIAPIQIAELDVRSLAEEQKQ